MRQVKISRWLASAVVCSLLLAAGCAPLGEEGVKPEKRMPKEVATMALKLSPQDSTTYKVIVESERSIKWEGAVPDEPTFKGGRNHERLEMTFDQEIQTVDDKGDAVAKITVKQLKLSSIVKDNSVLEFDSSKPKDPNYSLAKLIGHSYTIRIAPTGEVTKVISVRDAETAARIGSVDPRRALRILQPGTIKARHGTLLLPDANNNQLHIGNNWSITKDLSFGMMGSESYEKIYTLNEIEDQDNRQLAIIKMKAIPASETAKEQASAEFFENSDNIKTYTGELELDLTAGKVEKYFEKLRSEWITAFPSTEQETGQEGPAVLTMSETRLYSLEKID